MAPLSRSTSALRLVSTRLCPRLRAGVLAATSRPTFTSPPSTSNPTPRRNFFSSGRPPNPGPSFSPMTPAEMRYLADLLTDAQARGDSKERQIELVQAEIAAGRLPPLALDTARFIHRAPSFETFLLGLGVGLAGTAWYIWGTPSGKAEVEREAEVDLSPAWQEVRDRASKGQKGDVWASSS